MRAGRVIERLQSANRSNGRAFSFYTNDRANVKGVAAKSDSTVTDTDPVRDAAALTDGAADGETVAGVANVAAPGSAQSDVAGASDGRRVKGDRTKRAILAKAVDIASAEGLEGLSIGRLATELGVSKSGLFAHFGSKLELQLETVAAATEIFTEHVWEPVADLDAGIVQLGSLMESWLRYFRDGVFRGGCFFSNAYHEFDARPGPVRDEVIGQKRRWMAALVHHAKVAEKLGQLKPGTDAEQLAFELDALGSLANSMWQLERDERAFGRAQTAIRSRLQGAATASGRRALTSAGLTDAAEPAPPPKPARPPKPGRAATAN
jgi:AcrR family transcriptional regulator